jgi:hypothetical protein
MEQRLCCGVNRASAIQETPRILRNSNVYCRIHKSQPPVRFLNQIDPVHAPHSTSQRFTLILSSHPLLGLPSGLNPSGFPTEILYAPLLAPYVLHVLPISVFLIGHTNDIVMQSSPLCYLVPLKPKYPPQHPIFENPEPTFLPQSERPSFTPIRNNQ